MFGLDFSDLGEVFSKLPAPLQAALAVGVALAGAFLVIQKLTTKKHDEAVHPLAVELARSAAELADAKLRTDLIMVVETTRTALENRVEGRIGEVRSLIITSSDQLKGDIDHLEDRLRRLEQSG